MTLHGDSRWKYLVKSILFCVVFTGLFIIFSFGKKIVPNNFERLAHGLVGTLAAFITTLVFLKFEGKKLTDIELFFDRKTLVNFFLGVGLGIAIMGSLAGAVIYFTPLKIGINSDSNLPHFLLYTLPLIPLAFMEELAFRAYPLLTLKEGVGIRFSIIVTSILFALYHIANGWSVISSFYGPAVWGLLFGLAALYSRGIAMPTGIHYAANLATSAFGEKNNTTSIWIVGQPDNAIVKYSTVDWGTILPSLVLLVLVIPGIELYIRKNRST